MKTKKCPFCGKATAKEDKTSKGFLIVCTNCKCCTGVYESPEKALKAWNTRKPMDNIIEILQKGFNCFKNSSAQGVKEAFDFAMDIVKKENN